MRARWSPDGSRGGVHDPTCRGHDDLTQPSIFTPLPHADPPTPLAHAHAPSEHEHELAIFHSLPGYLSFPPTAPPQATPPPWRQALVENYLEYYHLPAVHPALCDVSGVDEHRRNQGTGMYLGFRTDPLTQAGSRARVANDDAVGWVASGAPWWCLVVGRILRPLAVGQR